MSVFCYIPAIFSAKIPAIILVSDSKFSFIEQRQKFLAFLRVLLNPVCYICYFLESLFLCECLNAIWSFLYRLFSLYEICGYLPSLRSN